jgi:GH15 family glucan-1,4-alpha-glucosidase
LSHGILNEIYFPRVDAACTRDLGLLVTDGSGFFSEEKRDCRFEVTPVEFGIPAFHLINTEKNGTYQIEEEIFADPHRNVVLPQIRFVESAEPRSTTAPSSLRYQVYALLAPHLGTPVSTIPAGWAITRAYPCCLPKFPLDSPLPLPVPYAGKNVGGICRLFRWLARALA